MPTPILILLDGKTEAGLGTTQTLLDKRECKLRAFQLKACVPTNHFFLDPYLLTPGRQEGGKLQTVIHFLIAIVGKKEGPKLPNGCSGRHSGCSNCDVARELGGLSTAHKNRSKEAGL